MAEPKRYRIGLQEGKSHTGPDGYRWQAGKFRTMTEGEQWTDHYLKSPRFSYQEIRPGDDDRGVPRRTGRRSRTDVREDRAERDRVRRDDVRADAVDDEDQEYDEDGQPIEDDDDEDPPAPPKPAPKPAAKPPAPKKPPAKKPAKYTESVLKNARRTVPDDIPRDAAELLAHKLGIEGADAIESLPELISKITQRQAEILADAGKE